MEVQRKKKHIPTKEELRHKLIKMMSELGLWKEELQEEIPTYWDNYSNFVIFNLKFFRSEHWDQAGPELWKLVSNLFSGKSVALQGKIMNDDFRSPNATVKFGESPWVEYLDNGIRYSWNVQYTMFCSGNVSERHRVASFECEGKVVVDMFAGIGYFTLPYLVHAKAQQVIACEWNPMSVEALKLNISINKISEKCSVFEGDVRINCPRGVADHVNLGLIPSCEQYWYTAAEILKPSGGMLHVHGNVTSFYKGEHFVIQCKKCSDLLELFSGDINNLPKEEVLKDFKMKILNSNDLKMEANSNGCIKWKQIEWFIWAVHVSHQFCEHLNSLSKTRWMVMPSFLHRVKPYAPHIDHLVVDILCENLY